MNKTANVRKFTLAECPLVIKKVGLGNHPKHINGTKNTAKLNKTRSLVVRTYLAELV